MNEPGVNPESQNNEQHLLDTFEQAAVGLAQISPDGRWLRLNRKYCEILGYNENELRGKNFQEITHPDDLDSNLRIHQQLLTGELDTCSWEKRYIRKDGEIVWVRVLASIVRNRVGNPLYSIAVVEDISSRKRAEEALRQSKEREQLAYEIIDDIRSEIELDKILRKTAEGIGRFTQADRCIIWLYDTEKRRFQIPNANREYCRGPEVQPLTAVIHQFPGIEESVVSDKPILPHALGYTKIANIPDMREVPGLTEQDLIAIRLRDIKSFLHVPILYKEQFLGCIRVHSTSCYRQWDEETVRLVENMAAKIAIAIHHAKTVQELKDSEARKTGILESSLDAIITIDQDGVVCEWNAAAERIFGYSRQAAIHRELAELIIPPWNRETFREELARAASEETNLEGPFEMVAMRADGTEFDAELTVTRVQIANVLLFTGTLRDITRRKKAEERLRRYAEKLEESNKDLESFATIVSQRLQIPLRKIQLFSEHMRQSAELRLNAEEKDDLDRLKKAADKMQTHIDDLLNLSKVNRQGKPLRKNELSFAVKDALRELAPYIEETGAQVEVEGDLTAEVDIEQLQILFFNLIENGLKFRRPDAPPVIMVSIALVDEAFYEISVQDNGLGIQPEQASRCFQMFQKLHGENYPGLGIGLSLVRKIAERHGGYATMESVPGEGSVFRVRLPFSPPIRTE
jgi:two-component system sensor kinase FixL